MKVLQLIKTSHGAQWALEQVKVLKHLGVEVHVVLPDLQGHFAKAWKKTGCEIHLLDTNLPLTRPDLFKQRANELKKLVDKIQPDLVHSHFFSSTIIMRNALKASSVKRIFQVPGPLHLENFFFKLWELKSANEQDYWIASSQYIKSLYIQSKISREKVFQSYYGSDYSSFTPLKDQSIRNSFGFSENQIIVGNLNYMYPPKYYLGQFEGVKRHELLIEALNLATEKNPKIKGLIIGGQWGEGNSYEEKLRKMARDNISFTGKINPALSHLYLANLDILVHIPLSENCGGIVEPMHMEIPVIAGKTGGLPELIEDEKNGKLIKDFTPESVSAQILEMVDKYEHYKELAKESREKVSQMFDVKNTGNEVFKIYKKILN